MHRKKKKVLNLAENIARENYFKMAKDFLKNV